MANSDKGKQVPVIRVEKPDEEESKGVEGEED
jgi:hypothetical protein